MPLGDRQEGFEEGPAHGLGKGEVGPPVAGAEVVVEDAADAARLAPVADQEIVVGPCLEAWIIGGVVRVAGGFRAVWKKAVSARDLDHRVQVGAAAEPPGGRRPEEPGVHVHRRERRAHMRDQADARWPRSAGRRPGPGISRRAVRVRCAGPARAAMHGGDVDPDLLEEPAPRRTDITPPPASSPPCRRAGSRLPRTGPAAGRQSAQRPGNPPAPRRRRRPSHGATRTRSCRPRLLRLGRSSPPPCDLPTKSSARSLSSPLSSLKCR